MTSKKILNTILQKILQSIDEGIHVIDNDGYTILYNEAMAELEGMSSEDVLGKKLLEVFPTLNHETSTLLKVLNTEQPIINQNQTYLNNRGIKITTINTTIPLFYENQKIGALEIAKNITKIKNLSDQIWKLQQELNEPVIPTKNKVKKYTFDHLIGRSPDFLRVIEIAKKAAASSSSVMIYGETGTGKELFAQSIHNHSKRHNKPFIAQNCAALPESLLEGILFGTVKGSFTGAVDRPGLFEQANGGTILLDEINSMGLQLQVKLLRVLQEGYVRRIGGTKDIPVDVRIIATTNEDPLKAVEKGIIRKDFYYRLNVINLVIPSLRERQQDIIMLANHFINKYNSEFKKNVTMLSDTVRESFLNYSWPGNVRELKNVIEGAMNMVKDESVLGEEHIPDYILNKRNKNPEPCTRTKIFEQDMNLNEMMAEIEKRYISAILKKYHGNISRTAQKLGIKRQTLQHKLKKYQI